jgi:hypothetical protein
MRRAVIILLALSACLTAAQAQTQLGGAPLPPAMAPGPTNLPSGFSEPSFSYSRPSYSQPEYSQPSYAEPSTVVRTRRGRTVVVPSGQANRNSFSDRVQRCIEGGTAAGIRPNGVGAFTRSCAN